MNTPPNISLRDWFAGMAMLGMVRDWNEQNCYAPPRPIGSAAFNTWVVIGEAGIDGLEWLADSAYQIADAMIEKRNLDAENQTGEPK